MTASSKRSQMIILFATVFIYLVGFGMIIPVLPALSRLHGANAFEVGLLMACYSFFQFLFAPIWGRISDRFGRRPVLLICLVADAAAMIGLAFADSFTSLMIYRTLAGVFGGSISTASAYMADITDAKDRSKGMGLIGAAFGIGFVFGPVLGGLLIGVGHHLGTGPPFGLNFPALAVAALCLVTFVFAWFELPEPERVRRRTSKVSLFKEAIKGPVSPYLLLAFFITSLGMANIEPTLFLLVFDRFQWDGETASYAFGYVGVMMAFTQGFLLRKLLPIVGEPRLMVIGLCTLAFGFFLIGLSHHLSVLVVAVTAVALGLGLSNPSIMGSLSASVSEDIQGEIFGVTQSLSALGRIIGPMTGGWIYQELGMAEPFYFAGSLAVIALILIISQFSRMPELARS